MGKVRNLFKAAKQKIKAVCRFALNKLGQFVIWVQRNPEAGMIAVAGIIGSKKIIKSEIRRIRKDARERKEERIKRSRIWDPSERHYWLLKRPLINQEWEKLLDRRETGESIHDILYRMGVLA